MLTSKRSMYLVLSLGFSVVQSHFRKDLETMHARYARSLERLHANLPIQSLFATLVDLRQLQSREEKDWKVLWQAQEKSELPWPVEFDVQAYKMENFDDPVLQRVLMPIFERLEQQLVANDLLKNDCFRNETFAKFRAVLQQAIQRNAIIWPTIADRYRSIFNRWIAQEVSLCMNVVLQSVDDFPIPTSFVTYDDLLAYIHRMSDLHHRNVRQIQALSCAESNELLAALKIKWQRLFQHRLVEPLLRWIQFPIQFNDRHDLGITISWYENPTQSLRAYDRLGAMLLGNAKLEKQWHIGVKAYIRSANQWFCQASIDTYRTQAVHARDWNRLHNFHQKFRQFVQGKKQFDRQMDGVIAAVMRCYDLVHANGLDDPFIRAEKEKPLRLRTPGAPF